MAATPFSYLRLRIYFSISWWIFFAGQLLLERWFGLPWKDAFIDCIISNGLLLAFCLMLMNTFRYYLPKKEQFINVFGICVVFTILWLLLSRWLASTYVDYYDSHPEVLRYSVPIRFSMGLLVLGCISLISALWFHWADQKENETRKADAEKLAKEAELFKLRQQLQPHFLFNSLNSINALIGMKPDEARKMVQQLSDFLRGTIRKEENQFISFSEELEYLKLYLEIEKVRFGYRLKTEMDISEESLNWKIPSLLLQPIMENAIKFGLYGTTGEVTIGLRATVADKHLVVAVMNPFDPDMQMPPGTGFGLNSVKRRLYLLFGRNELVEINKTQNSFIVIFRIPGSNA
ncbi:MAG: histidine kinase [Chitinophagaceae bacterium]